MPYKIVVTATLLSSVALASPLAAQDSGRSGEDDASSVIVVEAERLRGELQVEEAPIAELSSEDISALGASSIEDVLAAIEPATGSARGRGGGGRPVFLIDGIRVSGFREFYRYPPEAIAKVEVFPEETAQRFGFSPDRRVVNIILKENYSSFTAEVEYEGPDSGGYSRNEQEATYFKTAGGGRINVNIEVEDTSPLTEAERGLDVPGDPLAAEYRTLIADSFGVEGTANYAKAFIDTGASLSLTLGGEYSERLSLSGLRDVATLDPLERRTETETFTFDSNYSQQLGDFRLTTTLNGSRSETRQDIERLVDGGFDRALSNTWNGTVLNTLQGYIAQLPAGEVTTTLDFGYDWTAVTSKDTRGDQPVLLKRGDLSAGANLNIPLTSTRTGFLEDVGSISLNLQAGVNELSDFGTLTDWSAGLTWAPFENLDLQATRIWREVAPGLSALGAPQTTSFNVPVFDFATGQDVLVTVVDGGNPALLSETQADWKFGANWQLPFWDDARLRVDYAINNSDNVTLASPAYTAAFEQAFPDRIVRDGAGTLVSIDQRPVTLFRTRSRTLSFGVNARGRIGAQPQREGRGEARGEGERRPAPDGAQPRGQGESRGPRGDFDPARFAAMRETFCATPEGETPDLSTLPERMRARLLDENGQPDPQRIAAARARFCSADGAGAAGQGSGGGGQARGGGPGAGMLPIRSRSEDAGLRYFMSLNHTIALENEITLAPGGPVFDQLDGEVLSGGSVPRHTSELEGGLFYKGYGLRLSGRYTGKTELLGSGLPGSSDLFFGDLATFDVRLFADLGSIFERDNGILDGMRIAFRIDNVFDARRRVVDANGDTPFAFNPFRLDPTGRYLGVDLRKRF